LEEDGGWVGFGVGGEEADDAAGYSVERGFVQLRARGVGLLVLLLLVWLVSMGLFVLLVFFVLGASGVMLLFWFGFILGTLTVPYC